VSLDEYGWPVENSLEFVPCVGCIFWKSMILGAAGARSCHRIKENIFMASAIIRRDQAMQRVYLYGS
jgi:hypothetical protein